MVKEGWAREVLKNKVKKESAIFEFAEQFMRDDHWFIRPLFRRIYNTEPQETNYDRPHYALIKKSLRSRLQSISLRLRHLKEISCLFLSLNTLTIARWRTVP